jgi:excisionase family DNA binding protein
MPRTGVLGQATRIDPLPADHEALDGLRGREDLGDGELVLRTADGAEISLPQSLLRLVVSAAKSLAAGHAVMAIPAEITLTPAEAAELLGLSRPFVARLLEHGDIPSELLPDSRHRRIRLEEVLAFQARRERRAEGRRRIADIAATADLPYLSLRIVARVFVDTNVLFPFSVMDLMLARAGFELALASRRYRYVMPGRAGCGPPSALRWVGIRNDTIRLQPPSLSYRYIAWMPAASTADLGLGHPRMRPRCAMTALLTSR